MSWLVKDYLMHYIQLKTRLDHSEFLFVGGLEPGYLTHDNYSFDDQVNVYQDVDDDILDIENAIDILHESKVFSKNEKAVLDLIMEGYIFADVSKKLGIFRLTVYSNFDSACTKIAAHLGGHFTDEGFLNYMQDKYELDSASVEKLREFMNAKFNHK